MENKVRNFQHYFEIEFKWLPSKHSSWWRRTEDVLKTSWRRLQCNIFLSSKTSWRHNSKTSCKHVLKTSWRRFRKTYCKYLLKTSWKTKSATLKTSSRRLEYVLKNKKCLVGTYDYESCLAVRIIKWLINYYFCQSLKIIRNIYLLSTSSFRCYKWNYFDKTVWLSLRSVP